ncbi:MAG TPA: acyltransferase [Steroidobacteraceae bacterium]|nr:acyltransferase [Steroidobacteraceae bacterium]
MNSASAAVRQIPALDGIRGVAIIWVVFHNSTAMPMAAASRLLHVFPLLANCGWIGVQLFFALSGFLITGGLLDSQRSAHYFRNFYAKRALRILPLYYAVLLVLLVLVPLVARPPPPFSSEHQAPLWLFTANWTQSLPYGFAHFWSLAVEEQFYLIWPLLVVGLAPRRLLRACLWIAVGALLLRCALAAYGASTWTLYANTACRMDALALGGAGACLLRIPTLEAALRAKLPLVGTAALLVFVAGIPLTHLYNRDALSGATLGYTLLALSSAAFVTWTAMLEGRALSGIGVGAMLASAPLRSCGRYSYAMYVFHNLLHKLIGEPWLIGRFGKLPPLPIVFLYALSVLLITYVLAFCSYHALEKHFLRLKRPFEPSERVRNISA